MYKRILLSILAAGAVAVSASCDSARELTDVATTERSSAFDFRWAEPVTTLVTTQGQTTTTTVVAVIGVKGGRIENGLHSLTVPSRAVLTDTEFTFTVPSGEFIQADLTAKRVVDGAPVTTFLNPLTLRMSYAGASVADPSKLVVAWLVDNTPHGRKEKQPGGVNTGSMTVTGYLTHFSWYAVGLE